MIDIQLQRLPHGEGLPAPTYATEGAAGLDVVAAEDVTLAPGPAPRGRDRLRDRHPRGLRGPGPAALGPRAEARHHLPQHARHDRSRLSRRGEGDPRQSRHRAVRGAPRRAHRAAGAGAGARRRHFARSRARARPSRGAGGFGSTRAVSLSDAELERYARHIVLPQVGGVGQRQAQGSDGRRGRRRRHRQRGHPGARRRRRRAADDHRLRCGRARQSPSPAALSRARCGLFEGRTRAAIRPAAQPLRRSATPVQAADRYRTMRRSCSPATIW